VLWFVSVVVLVLVLKGLAKDEGMIRDLARKVGSKQDLRSDQFG